MLRATQKTISHYPDILLAETYTGLFILKKNGEKREVSHCPEGESYSPKTMYVEKGIIPKTRWVLLNPPVETLHATSLQGGDYTTPTGLSD